MCWWYKGSTLYPSQVKINSVLKKKYLSSFGERRLTGFCSFEAGKYLHFQLSKSELLFIQESWQLV
jgi:hypothetical protein